MTIFYVHVYEESVATYRVDAETAEEAEENYFEGDVIHIRDCASEVTDVRTEL